VICKAIKAASEYVEHARQVVPGNAAGVDQEIYARSEFR
jgi:hypothetical protein